MPFDPQSLSLPMLTAIFAAAAATVWFAGTRLTGYVDAISTKTGLGRAFSGMLLLGGITSLPEVAAVSTSAAVGNAPLAVNNLLGTASINLLLLAVADIVYGRDALTSVAAKPATLMQGVLSMVLASCVALVASVGDVAVFGLPFGIGAFLLSVGCIAALWISSDYEKRHVWEVIGDTAQEQQTSADGEGSDEQSGLASKPLMALITATAGIAALILIAGFLLSSSADAIAGKTGMGASMVGFVLVGFSTSLPEVSSITAAVRLRKYDMAVGDIFGTNLFNIALIFLADAVYAGDPVLASAGRFEVIGAVLAVTLTGAFIIGLLERRDRTVLRMGYDSLAALLLFTAGLFMLARWG
jgi:cation:H+ antiporter